MRNLTECIVALIILAHLSVSAGSVHASDRSENVEASPESWSVFELNIETERYFGPGKLADLENDMIADVQSSLDELADDDKTQKRRFVVIGTKAGKSTFQNQRRLLLATTYSETQQLPRQIASKIVESIKDKDIKGNVFEGKLLQVGETSVALLDEEPESKSEQDVSIRSILDTDGSKIFTLKTGAIANLRWKSVESSLRHPDKKGLRNRRDQFGEETRRKAQDRSWRSGVMNSRGIERAIKNLAQRGRFR